MALKQITVKQIAEELQLLSSRKQAPLFFHGETMLPFLEDGDHIVVKPANFEDINCGDIVIYKYYDHFPARRVLRVCPLRQCVVVNGDNLPAGMEFDVEKSDILGIVISRLRAGTWLDRSDKSWKRTAIRVTRRAWIARMLAPFTRDSPRWEKLIK